MCASCISINSCYIIFILGNGYRSIISIVESCLIKILQLSMQIQKSRDKLFFRSYHVYMELESYTQVLSRLLTVVHLTIVLLDYSDVGCLFPHDNIVEDLLVDFEKISRECFYGRSFGFQVCLSFSLMFLFYLLNCKRLPWKEYFIFTAFSSIRSKKSGCCYKKPSVTLKVTYTQMLPVLRYCQTN